MATPHVAGTALLMKQFVRLQNGSDIDPWSIEDVLNDTGSRKYDSASTRWYSRIDVYAALTYLASSPTITFVNPTPALTTSCQKHMPMQFLTAH